LGGAKIGSAVGRMWGGTSGHNGFIYDKGYVKKNCINKNILQY
jgi:hypothetical protein